MINLQNSVNCQKRVLVIRLWFMILVRMGFSMGYQYNGRLRSAEILYQEDGGARLIRRAETPEDYFATIKGFDFDN